MHKRLPQETHDVMGGWQHVYRFPNNYGASVIYHRGSYGVELAVVNWNAGPGGPIAYYTPITDNVVGWQSDAEIEALLDQIEALPPAPGPAEHQLLNNKARKEVT